MVGVVRRDGGGGGIVDVVNVVHEACNKGNVEEGIDLAYCPLCLVISKEGNDKGEGLGEVDNSKDVGVEGDEGEDECGDLLVLVGSGREGEELEEVGGGKEATHAHEEVEEDIKGEVEVRVQLHLLSSLLASVCLTLFSLSPSSPSHPSSSLPIVEL